jgi:hypothetical protein
MPVDAPVTTARGRLVLLMKTFLLFCPLLTLPETISFGYAGLRRNYSHSTDEIDLTHWGVEMARKGGIPPLPGFELFYAACIRDPSRRKKRAPSLQKFS